LNVPAVKRLELVAMRYTSMNIIARNNHNNLPAGNIAE